MSGLCPQYFGSLENKNRKGRCDQYQDLLRSVKVGIWRKGCKVGMHNECYYTYHLMRYGVLLINITGMK